MHKFKKEFGQNFLKNSKYAKSLVSNLLLTENDTVFEIGPGDGAVTKFLLESGARVIAFEIDEDLIPKLSSQFEGFSNFILINQSILEVNLVEIIEKYSIDTLKVAGALPYNISKKIIDIFLKLNLVLKKDLVTTCCFIVQEEVAKDYAAICPKASFLGSYSRVFAKVRKLESIPRYMFFPEPKVNGGIIKFENKKNLESNVLELVNLIRIGFSNPRKTLLNNLRSSTKFNEEKISEAYNLLKLSLTIRPAEIDADKWKDIYLILNS